MFISPDYVFGEFQKAAAFWKFSLFILELPLLLVLPSLFFSIILVLSLCSVHRSLAKTDWVFLNKEGEGSLWEVTSWCFWGSWTNTLRLFATGDFGTGSFWDLFSKNGDTIFVGVAFSFVCCLGSLSNWSNFLITLAIDLLEVLKPFETAGGLPTNKTKLQSIKSKKVWSSNPHTGNLLDEEKNNYEQRALIKIWYLFLSYLLKFDFLTLRCMVYL